MLTRFAIVMCLFTTACTDDGYINGRQGGKSLHKELCPTGCRDDVERALANDGDFEHVGDGMFVTGGVPGKIQLDVCDVLPENGACALVCDDGAIAALHPPGSCIDFTCALTDGRDLVYARCLPEHEITY